MLRYCCFSREELVGMIKTAPRTKDGCFFFPRFKVLILLQGKQADEGYHYDRIWFVNKICFTDLDIQMFLAKRKLNLDLSILNIIEQKLNEVLKGMEFLNLSDRIPGEDYTLEELIDTTIYITKYKNL